MDQPGLDPEAHRLALAGLRRLNVLSNAAAPVASAAGRMLSQAGIDPAEARIVDIATGGGDLLIGLARRGIGIAAIAGRLDGSGRAGHDRPHKGGRDWSADWSAGGVAATTDAAGAKLLGVDISQTALALANENSSRAGVRAEWLEADVLTGPLPLADQSVDLAVCSLFLHHLEPEGASRVLAEMARIARLGIIVSDLRRSRYGLALAAIAGRVMTRSRIVHIDSVRSVRAAWKAGEMLDLALRAGLRGARVRNIWPARMLLTWERPAKPREGRG